MFKYIQMIVLLISLPLGPVFANGTETANGQVTIRDPFSPSPLMYEVAGSMSTINTDQYGFRRSETADINMPQMKLRGFVTPQDGKEKLALLEIVGNGVFMVREGDEINIDPRQPASAIRIADITRLSVTIETGTLGRIRVLR